MKTLLKNKKILIGVVVVALIGGGIFFLKEKGKISFLRKVGEPLGPIQGELKILSQSPQGEELPISMEGITVMFDHPMVPLTTLDKGREAAIEIEMTPKVEGKFFWLGTRGFVFRPVKPFHQPRNIKSPSLKGSPLWMATNLKSP